MHIAIVGGSLAGATTALLLAKRGHQVTCVERRPKGHQKACGQGLLPKGVHAIKAMGLGAEFEDIGAASFEGIAYVLGQTRAIGKFHEGVGRGVHRGKLNALMREQAEAAGAHFLNDSFENIELTSKGVLLSLKKRGVIEADYAIGADGIRSRMRQKLGLDAKARGDRYALVQDIVWPGALPSTVQVHNCEGYELYLTPIEQGRVGIAALVSKGALPKVKKDERLRALIETCDSLSLPHYTPLSDMRTCGPLYARAKRAYKDRALLVGDSAGYVDAITGEGMTLAIECAHFAADAFDDISAGVSPTKAFKRYAKRRRGVFRDHAIMTHGLLWLTRHPRLAERTIALLAKDPKVFTRLLEVNNGERSIFSLSPLMLLKMAIGRSPKRLSATREKSAALMP